MIGRFFHNVANIRSTSKITRSSLTISHKKEPFNVPSLKLSVRVQSLSKLYLYKVKFIHSHIYTKLLYYRQEFFMADSVDPYVFDEEAYQPNPGTVDFSESFCQELFGSDSDSEEEFTGFTREEVHLAPGSRVRAFHERTDPIEETEKENERGQAGRGRKRARDPSR